jgi:hypothetical protein
MDVQLLCNVHIPQWLATPGMGAAKIAAFYDDPEKQAYDAFCTGKAHALKSLSIDTGLSWVARRWARFVFHGARGALRAARLPRGAKPAPGRSPGLATVTRE